MKAASLILVAAVLFGRGGFPAGAQHAGDILVGRVAGQPPQLAATGVPERTVFLAPVSSGPFHGWSGTALGFDAVAGPEPLQGLLPLAPGSSVHLAVVSIDPGLSLRSFTAPARVFVDEPGERLRLGGSGSLHDHPIVFLDGARVGNHFTGLRQVRFRLVDLGSAGHAASPEYLLTFAPLNTRLEHRRVGEDLEISFLAHSRLAYRIEVASSVSGPWSALGDPIRGTGETHAIRVRPTSDPRLYRALAFIDN